MYPVSYVYKRQVSVSSEGNKLQISTATVGSLGSVQIRSGLANSATALVQGGAYKTTDNAAGYVLIPTSQISGFHSEWPIRINNTNPYVKDSVLSSISLTSINASTKTWTFNGSLATSPSPNKGMWQIQHHGDMTAFVWADTTSFDFGSIVPGDYVIVEAGTSASYETWEALHSYSRGNLIAYSGNYYRSLQANNTGHVPVFSPQWWALETLSSNNTGQFLSLIHI